MHNELQSLFALIFIIFFFFHLFFLEALDDGSKNAVQRLTKVGSQDENQSLLLDFFTVKS